MLIHNYKDILRKENLISSHLTGYNFDYRDLPDWKIFYETHVNIHFIQTPFIWEDNIKYLSVPFRLNNRIFSLIAFRDDKVDLVANLGAAWGAVEFKNIIRRNFKEPMSGSNV